MSKYSCTLFYAASEKFLDNILIDSVTMASLLVPPDSVCGQKVLDRSKFNRSFEKIPCIESNLPILQQDMLYLKKFLLKIRNFKPIKYTGDKVLIYLNPNQIKSIQDLPENIRTRMHHSNFRECTLNLGYENWSVHQVLRAILPSTIEIPTSFSQIGHLIHLNLRNEQLPYKDIIGQVLLDKIPHAKTVINKTNNIDTVFRHFRMEILAGENNTNVEVKENGCIYCFDFTRVFWNPRLSTEHRVLIGMINPGDTLYDVFAGVGPFSILAAKKGVHVLANDLNFESYKSLEKNSNINKINNFIQIFNLDGKEFLERIFKRDILEKRRKHTESSEHIVMNLPDTAVQFVEILFTLFTQEEIELILSKSPILHLYCFIKCSKSNDLYKLTKEFIEAKTNVKFNGKCLNIHHVRNVSPNKEMVRLSFKLSDGITAAGGPAMKKLKSFDENIL